MSGTKGDRRAPEESYNHPPDEIQACMTCRLPDCRPAEHACNLRILRSKKAGREIKLK